MAGPYYVDIGTQGAWNTRDGLSSGACWYGTTGLQNAFDTAAANEIVYIKGTADLSKHYTVPYDANSGNLTNGEAVTWHDGAGVVQFTGAMATPVAIELTSGNAPSDGDTVTGTTSGNTITAHTGIANYTLDIDTNAGSITTGVISFVGVNSSWTKDGTRSTINVNSSPVNGITVGATAHFVYLENIEVKSCGGSSKHGISFGTCNRPTCVNVSCHNCSGDGILADSPANILFIRCVAYSNSYCGIESTIYNSRLLFCCAHDNASTGLAVGYVSIGCLSYDNGGSGYQLSNSGPVVMHSVANLNDINPGVNAGTGTIQPVILGCRITNATGSAAGIDWKSRFGISMANYFKDNGGSAANDEINDSYVVNIALDGSATNSNIYDSTDDDEGYVSQTDGSEDFNLNSDALLRRTAIAIPTT